MVDYETKAPGVYIEEITPTGPIAGAGTSTAALIGTATTVAKADMGVPVAITNWTSYTGRFGDYSSKLPLPYAVRGFFENGGTLAYVVAVKDFTGLADALGQLTRVPEVNLVCAPGLVDSAAQETVLAHCEDMGNRFGVLDGAQDGTPLDAAGPLRTQRGGLLSKSGYGALYWPWIVVDDPVAAAGTPPVVAVPPSGHMAGIMARSDGQVGVHKAPANEVVRGARDLGYTLNDTEQGVLNHLNINAIRRFPGSPPVVWGARTLTDGTPWRYVNVRRLVSYVEASILEGVRWAVFEPNTPALWKALERVISEFLTRVWQAGALFGLTAKQAFYVKIDEELNPEPVRTLGEVVVEIGLAPVRPAEYVIVRLGLWDGGSQVTEG
jgi:phage tail sheath protein FI